MISTYYTKPLKSSDTIKKEAIEGCCEKHYVETDVQSALMYEYDMLVIKYRLLLEHTQSIKAERVQEYIDSLSSR